MRKVGEIKKEMIKCWEIHRVVRVDARSASRIVHRARMGRLGGGGGERETEREVGREREREARAQSLGLTPLSHHTQSSRAPCSVLDREDRGWKLTGAALQATPGPAAGRLADFWTFFHLFLHCPEAPSASAPPPHHLP